MTADWSVLPSNVVDSVASRLIAADQARLAATCKSWWLAMADGFCRSRRKPSIWIVLGSFNHQGDHGNLCNFQSFSEGMKRRYVFPMPAADTRVLGSSQGWLMLEDAATRIHAFNPITKETLSFPVANCCEQEMYLGVKKAIMVRREGRSVTVAIIRQVLDTDHCFFEAAMAELGEEAWTSVRRPHVSVIDFAVHQRPHHEVNSGNRVFSRKSRGKNRTVVSFLFEPTTMGQEINNDHNCKNHLGIIYDKPVLVRSWPCRSPCPADWDRRPLEVFSLDSAGSDAKWVAIKDLDGHALLVGYDGIIALRAEEFEDLEADSVYCLDREVPHNSKNLPVIVVLNVKTGAMTFEPISIPCCCIPIWFLPNPVRS